MSVAGQSPAAAFGRDIVQGPFVPASFYNWWFNEGLKALLPEVVAASRDLVVLDLRAPGGGDASRPLSRIFKIVQLLISSAGFKADPKSTIDMRIAPRWQAELLKAEVANGGGDAVEAQLKAELACKSTRSKVVAAGGCQGRFAATRNAQAGVRAQVQVRAEGRAAAAERHLDIR